MRRVFDPCENFRYVDCVANNSNVHRNKMCNRRFIVLYYFTPEMKMLHKLRLIEK